MVDLEVDSNDGAQIATMSAPVDANGDVIFANVPVAAPGVQLHATGQGVCGIGRDQLAFAVSGASNGSGGGVGSGGGSGGGGGSGVPVDTGPCSISLDPAPEANAFYAPSGIAGVLTTHSDPDPATAGYQTTVHVKTAPGWTAEVFETFDGATSGVAPTSLGQMTADATGQASAPATVFDGAIGLHAVCHGLHGGVSTSRTTHVLVDITPPACEIEAPAPGTTIPANGKPTAQVTFTVHAGDADVVREPVGFTLTGNGATIDGKPSRVRPDGTAATVPVPLAAGTYDARLTLRDHAGNVCTADATYSVVP